MRFMEAFPGPIGYEPVKEGGSGADDFGHHVVLRFGARQIHEPDPLYGIFSLQDFGDAPALGISLHENIDTLAGLLIDSVQIGIQCSREQKPLEMTRMVRFQVPEVQPALFADGLLLRKLQIRKVIIAVKGVAQAVVLVGDMLGQRATLRSRMILKHGAPPVNRAVTVRVFCPNCILLCSHIICQWFF